MPPLCRPRLQPVRVPAPSKPAPCPLLPRLVACGAKRVSKSDAEREAAWSALDPYRRALGVDYGRVKTGVAVSAGGLAPRPVAVLRLLGVLPADELLAALIELAGKENVTEIVVGLPHTLRRGSPVAHATPQTAFCRRFAEKLADRAAPLGFRVWLADENGTSSAARERLSASGVSAGRREGLEDSVAAALILDNYFSARAGVPRLVAPAVGLPRLPPAQRDNSLALAWLGERPPRVRPPRPEAEGGAAAAPPPAPSPRGGVAREAKPPMPPPRKVSVSVLRREPQAQSRREQLGELGEMT